MVKADFLQSYALFGGISDDVIEHTIPLLREENFSKGEMIVKEGELGDRLYFLCQGFVEVLKEVPTANGVTYKQLAVLGEGDTFGEMELIDVQQRSASIRALENVTALTLSRSDIYTIYTSDIEAFIMIIMNMAREISRRLRKMDALVGSSLYSGSFSNQFKTGSKQRG